MVGMNEQASLHPQMDQARPSASLAPDERRRSVSIVTPFFNEGHEVVERFREALVGVFERMPGIEFEVVCVDDGSTDDTLVSLLSTMQSDRRFVVLELSRNFGKEAALTAGLDGASGDAVIPFDADLQDPPGIIPLLIEEWQKGADAVLARRSDRRSDSLAKRKSAELFYKFHNRLSTVKIPEDVGDFRLVDRAVVDCLTQLPEQQRFMKGLFAWVGFRTVTVDYARMPRSAGEGKFSGWKLWNLALEGITGFSSVPLKVWTYVGSVFATITFLYGLFIVVRTLVFGVDLPGYASLLVAILFFGSLQLISLGILGEYIGRIYMESKRRPLYIIRRRYGGK